MDVATAAPGRAVSLPGGVDDWIVAGANGTDTVRYLRGGQQISGPHLTGNPTARSVHGPFAVSWTGDLNNQSGSESNWLSVTGPAGGPETGLLLRVPATARSAILVLYVGASGADGELQARLGDHGTVVRSPLRVSSQGSGNVRSGTVVTIRFQASGVGDSLQVELSCGSGGSINLAAATLS
jgi:hypothetical protein